MGIHEWSYDNDISLDLRFKVPLKEKDLALKDIKVEVELGFDEALAFKEAQRCLNCDVQTVFKASLCIECDACVDICPVDCITFTDNGPEPELRQRLSAPATNLTQDLYVADGLKTGPRHDQGRGRVPALRHVRGALPEPAPGHAEIPPQRHARGARMPQPLNRTNDFVVSRERQRLRSASANTLFAKSILRMGVPISPRNIFPSNIQGLPTWYEGPGQRRGLAGARGGGRRPDGGDEPADLDKDVASIVPGGYLFLYDSTKPMPAAKFGRTSTVIGMPPTARQT